MAVKGALRTPQQQLFSKEPRLQGRDAWNAVGGAAVEVATTLDSAVEQLLEGWTSPHAGASRVSGDPCANRAEGSRAAQEHRVRGPAS